MNLRYMPIILTVLMTGSFLLPVNADELPLTAELTLEINAVQIVLNDEHRDGVDWEAIVSDFHTLQLAQEDNPLWDDKAYKISVGSVSRDDYTVLIDALDTVGKMTQSTQAPINIKADTKQTVYVAFGDAKNMDNMRCDFLLSMLPKGELKLRIEPHIRYVLKDGKHSEAALLTSQTDVVLKENTVIALGGIISQQEITKTHKFPLLGDLPIVGLVFRSQGRLMQKTETMIFLTPHFKSVLPEETDEKDNS